MPVAPCVLFLLLTQAEASVASRRASEMRMSEECGMLRRALDCAMAQVGKTLCVLVFVC